MNQKFIAEITLATPLIADKLVGDSLLAGIAYQQHHDWRRAIAEVPIAHVADIPQMSMMLPYALATKVTQRVTIYRSIMRDMNHDPDMATMLDKMPPRSYLTTASGPLSNIGNTYSMSDLPKIYFIGCGDIDGVEQLLRSVSFIGSQKAKGYGQVASVNVWPVDNPEAQNNEWFGIVGSRNGRNIALRPIPRRLSHLLPPNVDHILSTETWHNPYHPGWPDSVVEPCWTPPFFEGESFSEHDVSGEIGCIISHTDMATST